LAANLITLPHLLLRSTRHRCCSCKGSATAVTACLHVSLLLQAAHAA
jgi:hypothetical protein